MKIAVCGLVLALSGLTGRTAGAQGPARVMSDSARLQGKFVLVGGTQWGSPLPSSALGNSYRTTTGNQLTVTLGGQLLLKKMRLRR